MSQCNFPECGCELICERHAKSYPKGDGFPLDPRAPLMPYKVGFKLDLSCLKGFIGDGNARESIKPYELGSREPVMMETTNEISEGFNHPEKGQVIAQIPPVSTKIIELLKRLAERMLLNENHPDVSNKSDMLLYEKAISAIDEYEESKPELSLEQLWEHAKEIGGQNFFSIAKSNMLTIVNGFWNGVDFFSVSGNSPQECLEKWKIEMNRRLNLEAEHINEAAQPDENLNDDIDTPDV